jgi:hypothetical protein
MYHGNKVTLDFTVGTIRKMRLENHLRLLLRFNILFRLTRQDSQAHHTEAEEKEEGQTAEVSDIVAIHDFIICEFCPVQVNLKSRTHSNHGYILANEIADWLSPLEYSL